MAVLTDQQNVAILRAVAANRNGVSYLALQANEDWSRPTERHAREAGGRDRRAGGEARAGVPGVGGAEGEAGVRYGAADVS